jgi:hypothetical protein
MSVGVDPRDEFLALILGGATPPEAAQMMNMTTSYFRSLRNPLSRKYDKQFADDYNRLMEAVREHEAQRMRGAALCRALGKHDFEPIPDGPLICTRCGRLPL